MRIIAGSLRRRALHVPPGLLTRPSTERVREAIFNLVTHRVPLQDTAVLDLFAGTGALGLEAISRGAEKVVFVESHPRVLRAARDNALQLNVAHQCTFIQQDALTYLARLKGISYDVIFADPPYTLEKMEQLPAMVIPHVKPHGRFILEHDARISFATHPLLDCSRPYGRTIVSIFSPAPCS